NTATSVISWIDLDGTMLTEVEEKSLEQLPLKEVQSIEIHVCSPRELAEDTLQTALSFTDDLLPLFDQALIELRSGQAGASLSQLLDGISIFTEAVLRVRQLLGIKEKSPADAIESGTATVLSAILAHYKKREFLEMAALIDEDLRKNLFSWRDIGIPALIASRDS
ncbi:MAG: hypothetical protein AABZ55_04255, partial [Bdellovibrionota bacterium]